MFANRYKVSFIKNIDGFQIDCFKFSTSALNAGCNYCFWAINFLTVPVRSAEERISLTRDVGRIQMEMTCMFTLADVDTR